VLLYTFLSAIFLVFALLARERRLDPFKLLWGGTQVKFIFCWELSDWGAFFHLSFSISVCCFQTFFLKRDIALRQIERRKYNKIVCKKNTFFYKEGMKTLDLNQKSIFFNCLKCAFRNQSLKAHFKVGNIFVGFFWQPGVKGCLEPSWVRNPDPQIPSVMPWPLCHRDSVTKSIFWLWCFSFKILNLYG